MPDIEPDFSTFDATYQAGTPQLVWQTHIADLETPVSAFMKLASDQPYGFLLESVEDGDHRGRHSIIGTAPDLVFEVRDGQAYQISKHHQQTTEEKILASSPLEALREVLAKSTLSIPDTLPPMAAGLFGYLAYDMVREMEAIPDRNPDMLSLADCVLVRPTLIAVFDNLNNTLTLVVPIRPSGGNSTTARAAYDAATLQIEQAVVALKKPVPDLASDLTPDSAPDTTQIQSNMSRDAYCKMVTRARDYIEAGDIFQTVVSQRFSRPFAAHPFMLYRSLRRINPSPFLFFLNFPDFAMVGSSPEVLVGVKGREINIRPLAGTRRRGLTPDEDTKISAELLADEKERAEHLMLLDLGRNDAGRVSTIGSVKVDMSFGVQKTSHLIHILSNVLGTLAPQYDVIDALTAGFPAGTVTGAPKIRAMEIIDELEPVRRGPYAGCVGYFSAGGNMDSCITLRTGIIKDGTLYVQAGAGIVYDSIPESEYDETINKAAALFRAAEDALKIPETT